MGLKTSGQLSWASGMPSLSVSVSVRVWAGSGAAGRRPARRRSSVGRRCFIGWWFFVFDSDQDWLFVVLELCC